jgi:outer membrane protein TolC
MKRSGTFFFLTLVFASSFGSVSHAQLLLPSQQPPTGFGASTPAPIALTLTEAVARGLRQNVDARVQEAELVMARGDRWTAMRDLLPTASARLSYSRQVINLAVFGFSLPGVPSIVGPFNLHDARLFVSQPIVDLNALYQSRSGAASLRAAELDTKDTRSLVTFAVRDLYLQAVASESLLTAARAQSDTARALLAQATDLRNAGVGAGIDVIRAQVQAHVEEQRVIAAANEFEKEKLQLARAIGLPLDQPLSLVDQIPYAPLDGMPLDAALKQALTARDDYRAAQERLQAAEASRRAATSANLPSLHVNADYGEIGNTPANTHSTYFVGAEVRIPLFDSATTRGHVLEAQGLIDRRRAELDDFRARVEYEVRAAYLDVRAADERLQTARETMQLASQELAQSRDRFAAGVTGNIEVIQAQESVANASEEYISSLYAHNLAKASLAHAIGGTIP